jgi:hypothetical protein
MGPGGAREAPLLRGAKFQNGSINLLDGAKGRLALLLLHAIELLRLGERAGDGRLHDAARADEHARQNQRRRFDSVNWSKRDFGEIGFQQDPRAAYLIFPKPLPKGEATHVIGIKYELLSEPRVLNLDAEPPQRQRTAKLPNWSCKITSSSSLCSC